MQTPDQQCAQRIEELVRRVDAMADPESRDVARQLMESILEMYGAGLNRMMEITFQAGDTGASLIRRFGSDPLVSSLLILHDLHPDDLETRVYRALGRWHGAAELLGAFEGVVRVRLSGSECGLREAVNAAIREAAPDAVEVILEESFRPAGFVPLSALDLGQSGAQ